MSPLPLAGKTALVLGGSRGIGAAIVRRLASDGASVLFTFASAAAQADAVVADVTAGGGQAPDDGGSDASRASRDEGGLAGEGRDDLGGHGIHPWLIVE